MSRGVDTQMHLFENTLHLEHRQQQAQTQRQQSFAQNGDSKRGSLLDLASDMLESRRELAPIQAVYALKEHNAGKLNSHLWFFDAFAAQLQPTFTVLLDVGTMPQPSAIWRLLRSMTPPS